MEYSAIYHDMDKRFCYAIDKDLFVIRVQVKKDDMKEIILHCEDKYIPMERKDTKKTILMKKIATSQFHDYYEAQLQMHLICLRYYFEFTDTQGEKIYYGNYEFYKECITNRDRMFDCPQNLREEEMFEVPDWAANKVVYQIFPARFAASQRTFLLIQYGLPLMMFCHSICAISIRSEEIISTLNSFSALILNKFMINSFTRVNMFICHRLKCQAVYILHLSCATE